MKLSDYWYKLQLGDSSITNDTSYSVVFEDGTETSYPHTTKGYVGGLYLTQRDYPNQELLHCLGFRGKDGKTFHIQFFIGGYKK